MHKLRLHIARLSAIHLTARDLDKRSICVPNNRVVAQPGAVYLKRNFMFLPLTSNQIMKCYRVQDKISKVLEMILNSLNSQDRLIVFCAQIAPDARVPASTNADSSVERDDSQPAEIISPIQAE